MNVIAIASIPARPKRGKKANTVAEGIAEGRSLHRLTELRQERARLAELASEFEPLIPDTDASPDQIQDAIEELRAIRMRIHEIDRDIRELESLD